MFGQTFRLSFIIKRGIDTLEEQLMKSFTKISAGAFLINTLWVNALYAQTPGDAMPAQQESAPLTHHSTAHSTPSVSTYTLTATSKAPLQEGQPAEITLFLSENGRPITQDQLKTVHTKKLHALINDPTLKDYHHAHPVPGSKPGEYTFTFTPETSNRYRIWLDITPENKAQEYIIADLSGKNLETPSVEKIVATNSVVDGYQFELRFDKKTLKMGQPLMGTLMVKDKDGNPVTELQPIMEAFAHIVAFNEDYKTILHIHPMGTQPTDSSARGGPRIDFHITPSASGYVKLFAQVQIGGKEIIAPFGVNIEN